MAEPQHDDAHDRSGNINGDRGALERLRARIAECVGQERFNRYFGQSTRLELNNDRLSVTVPDRFTADLLDRRFGEDIRRALADELGDTETEDPRLRFRVDGEAFGETDAPDRASGRITSPPRRRPMPAPRQRHRYRLSDFIVGESNRVAFTAAVRLAEGDRAEAFSPLFLHGACGLGKTHLLQGIASRFREVRPDARVRCTTAEAFTNEFIASIRSGSVDRFQQRYRGVDLLCIDDVHFFSNKERTQSELLHTFDTLDLDGARVVLASDEHPGDIARLSSQLVSRFVAGAVVRIDPPDARLAERIVRHRAGARGLPLDEEAVHAIVERASGQNADRGGAISVRDLEGLLVQVEALHRLMPSLTGPGGRIGGRLVTRALELRRADTHADALATSRPVAIDRIVAVVCDHLAVTAADLFGRGRHRRVVLARALIVHLGRRLTNKSYPEIARAMARTNHSTVATAHKRILAQISAGDAVRVGTASDGLTVGELADRLERELRRTPGRHETTRRA